MEKKEAWKNYIPFPDDLDLVYIENGYHQLHHESVKSLAKAEKESPEWVAEMDRPDPKFPGMQPFNILRHYIGSLRAFVRMKNGLLLSIWYNPNGINPPIFEMIGPTFEIYSFNYNVEEDTGMRFFSMDEVVEAIRYLETIDRKKLSKSDWDEYDPHLHGGVNSKGELLQ